MVVASNIPATRSEKIRVLIELPVIDLSLERSDVSKSIVKASEEYGFFKVTNHGVPQHIIDAMEDESSSFFAKTMTEKLKVSPAKPFGYGSKNIGFNGDMGELEYLILKPNDPISIANMSHTISHDPSKFSCALSGYVRAVAELAREIADLMAEGLRLHDKSVFRRMIGHADSDSVFRLNHYPPLNLPAHRGDGPTVGFGAHSDPQILTLLRSNDVGGLQISPEEGVWVPVTPDPTAFCVNVGDALQAMTNGRFLSVRHRAMTNSYEARMSMAYFCAPPLDAKIACLPEMVTPERPLLYRPFTWGEYKKTAYSMCLGDSRLELFRSRGEDKEEEDDGDHFVV